MICVVGQVIYIFLKVINLDSFICLLGEFILKCVFSFVWNTFVMGFLKVFRIVNLYYLVSILCLCLYVVGGCNMFGKCFSLLVGGCNLG